MPRGRVCFIACGAHSATQPGGRGCVLQIGRPIVETRYESSMQMFDGMTYAKGACVLHCLRGSLGDTAWWKGLRASDRTADRRDPLRIVDADVRWNDLCQGGVCASLPAGLTRRHSLVEGAACL